VEPKRRRELSLAAVALVLAATAAWMMQPGGLGITAPSASRAPATTTAARSDGAVGALDLNALGKDRPEPQTTERNPFRFKPKPPPPPPKPAATTTPEPPPVAAGPVEPPPPPRIPLKYIGDMADPAAPGKRIAILSDGRGAYYGREGDIIEGRYRVVKIGVESIELAHLDGRGRQTIRQTGQ
jgi:hypothetical protein